MFPRASWISVALFALTSAVLMGFLGCSSSRTIPTSTVQQQFRGQPSKIMAPALHAKMARQQAGLPAMPKSKLALATGKSPKLTLRKQIQRKETPSAIDAKIISAR